MLAISGGRHPVVEAGLGGESFIPNDCLLGGDGPAVSSSPVPNMGGKSTYLRQVAVIVLLAQVGSFVPASSARVGLVDRIFTRVGAHDDLAGGPAPSWSRWSRRRRSCIKRPAAASSSWTKSAAAPAPTMGWPSPARYSKTSTTAIGARTLFATHYLELTALAETSPGRRQRPRRRAGARGPRRLPLRGPAWSGRPRLWYPRRPPRRSAALGRGSRAVAAERVDRRSTCHRVFLVAGGASVERLPPC